MAEGLIHTILKTVDTRGLTATKNDVASPYTFYGAGDSDKQSGVIFNQGSPEITLPLDGNYTLPAGYYSGGTIGQKISYMEETHVSPGSQTITVHTKDVYMAGNIIVDALPNLKPENIKKGEYVGGVGPGTWEGYVVTDPNTFYYYGTFGPGQSLSDYAYEEAEGYKLKRESFKDHIQFTRNTGLGTDSILVFNNSVDLTSLSRLQFEIVNTISGSNYNVQYVVYLCRNRHETVGELESEYIAKKNFTFGSDTNGKKTAFELDVSPYSRDAYLHIDLICNTIGVSAGIYMVKFS